MPFTYQLWLLILIKCIRINHYCYMLPYAAEALFEWRGGKGFASHLRDPLFPGIVIHTCNNSINICWKGTWVSQAPAITLGFWCCLLVLQLVVHSHQPRKDLCWITKRGQGEGQGIHWSEAKNSARIRWGPDCIGIVASYSNTRH